MKALLDQPRHGGRVLLTGGTGYLGSLLAAQMLHDGWAEHLVIPTRKPLQDGTIPVELERELQALGADVPGLRGRIALHGWAGAESADVDALSALLRDNAITAVVHCAGCLDYFNEEGLKALNEEFTARLAEASRRAGVRCFVFVSTAYSAGYSGGRVPEGPLDDPHSDPTYYTSSKRNAERIVAASGLPFLIVRPSIVIGSSRDGRYSGKRYGLYQQWMGVERLLTGQYHGELHTVATDQPLNLLHQDAFQAAMHSLLRWVPDGEYVNLVVDEHQAPTMKTLWRLFCEVTRPQRVVFYPGLDQVDLKALNVRQRAYLSFAQTNLEIGAYPWRFERHWLLRLREKGLDFVETSVQTLRVCQDRFVASSAALERYAERFGGEMASEVQYCDAREAVLEPSLD